MALTDSVLIGAPERSGQAGVVGYAYRTQAPLSGVLPLTPSSALPVGAADLSFVSEDGLAISTDRTLEYIRDWNLDSVRALLTEHEATLTFSLIGWTPETLRAWAGDENVTEDATSWTVRINSSASRPGGWIFNMKDGDSRRRVVVPNAVVGSQGEVVFRKGEQTALEIELTPLADDDGNKIYITTEDGTVQPV